jgi:hypothetical protein
MDEMVAYTIVVVLVRRQLMVEESKKIGVVEVVELVVEWEKNKLQKMKSSLSLNWKIDSNIVLVDFVSLMLDMVDMIVDHVDFEQNVEMVIIEKEEQKVVAM